MSDTAVAKVRPAGRRQTTLVRQDDPLLTPTDAAPYLGIAVNTLNNWRAERRPGRVIAYLKVGGTVLYRKSVLDAFLVQCERNG